jgi:hypothetical protein
MSHRSTKYRATHKVSAPWAVTFTTTETEVHHEEVDLAAAAVLSLGVGSAFAHQTVINSHGQVIRGPAYSNDATGG